MVHTASLDLPPRGQPGGARGQRRRQRPSRTPRRRYYSAVSVQSLPAAGGPSSWTVRIGDAVLVCLGTGTEEPGAEEPVPVQVLSIYADDCGGPSPSGPSARLEVRRLYRHADLAGRGVPGLLGDSRTGVGSAAAFAGGVPEEVLETYDLLRGLDAGRVVGWVRLVDGEGREFGRAVAAAEPGGAADAPAPAATYLCHRFYSGDEERIMHLAGAADRSVRRALVYSDLLKHDPGGLAEALRDGAGLASLRDRQSDPRPPSGPLRIPPPLPIQGASGTDAPTAGVTGHRRQRPSQRCYYDVARLPVDWSALQYGRVLCDPDRGAGLYWTARVGDVVAVSASASSGRGGGGGGGRGRGRRRGDDDNNDDDNDDDDALDCHTAADVSAGLDLGMARPPRVSPGVSDKGGNVWYPFRRDLPWRPCRVLAIYMDGNRDGDGDDPPPSTGSYPASCSVWRSLEHRNPALRFELQILHRTVDAEAYGLALPDAGDRHEDAPDVDLIETETTVEVKSEALLGPVTVLPNTAGRLDGEPPASPDEWMTARHIATASASAPSSRGCGILPTIFQTCKWSYNSSGRGLQALPMGREGIIDLADRVLQISLHYGRSEHISSLISSKLLDGGFSEDDGNDWRSARKRGSAETMGLIPNKKRSNRATDSDESDTEDHHESAPKALMVGTPYHIDVSSAKSFYTGIKLTPNWGHFAPPFQNPPNHDKVEVNWAVELGDTVAVHFGFRGQTNSSSKHPFRISWSPAEVVCIWRRHQSTDASDVASGDSAANCEEEVEIDEVGIEIRWLYRSHEIAGSARKTSCHESSNGLEEIIETDEVIVCTAASVLAPIELFPSSISSSNPLIDSIGMPVMQYQCQRFWSVHRKSLMPSGSLKGRVQRGRMYSNYFGKDALLRAALDKRIGLTAPVQPTVQLDGPECIRSNFQEAVSRLSLSDASADAQVRGMELTGRAKEVRTITCHRGCYVMFRSTARLHPYVSLSSFAPILQLEQIRSFLRSAILGGRGKFEDIESSVKASMFIAGPPGTGKTACVNAVISQLRSEQARGEIPSFDFVSLNGMEMQYPFDAYVRLWEAVSELKEKRSPGVAAAMLERYFAGTAKSSSLSASRHSIVPRRVTVLLLDEIDYLVTKKQSVLYNFFEWPRRSAANGSGARLVVVGISNTINLPERLKPSVQSRLGRERCVFKAYNVEETCNILKSRLEGDGKHCRSVNSVFDHDSLTFAARKTAVLSGDIRRAFQMCKNAAEAVLSQIEDKSRTMNTGRVQQVRISDVQKASRDMFNSIINRAVASATSFEALLVVSIASLQKHTGRERGGFDVQDLLTKMKGIAESTGDDQYLPAPSFSELIGILNRLGEVSFEFIVALLILY